MAEALEIPVTYKNEELLFKANVVRVGYVNHIVVDIDGTQVTIERDEDGNYRALVDTETVYDNKLDKEIIGKVVEVLQSL